LVFEMGKIPNNEWGGSQDNRPVTKKFINAVAMPYYKIEENYFFDKATISLGSNTEGAKIYFSTNEEDDAEKYSLYTDPFQIKETTTIYFFAQKEGFMNSTVVTETIEKLEKTEVAHFKNYDSESLIPGLEYQYFEDNVLYVDELDQLTPKKTGITSHFSIADRENDGLFDFIYSGFIKIPTDGVYTFFLSTNDGGVLYLDGKRFIDKDGPGTATPLSRTISLKAGTYKIGEKYFQMGGGYSNTISWKGPGIKKEEIPGTVLFHK